MAHYNTIRLQCCFQHTVFDDFIKWVEQEIKAKRFASLSHAIVRAVEIPRIRHGQKQTLDTLIGEEALLFAKFLRNENVKWKDRKPYLY